MPISTETPASADTAAAKERPGTELVLVYGFGPAAERLARTLVPVGVSPVAVVVANAIAGLAGAVAIAGGAFVLGALLLQLKTLLDNVDGRLARLSGRVSLLGRYLDTEADLVVNATLFGTLGHATGEWALAVAGFVALTLVLSTSFNYAELQRHGRGVVPARSGGLVERALEWIYALVFAPQDRALQGFSRARLERLGQGVPAEAAARVYYDRGTANALANLGLSTQLAVLGVCLVVDLPELYLWLVVGSLALLPLLQLRREHRVRRALSARRAG